MVRDRARLQGAGPGLKSGPANDCAGLPDTPPSHRLVGSPQTTAVGCGTAGRLRAWQDMNYVHGSVAALLLALSAPAFPLSGGAHGHAIANPSPEVDWQVGVIALAAIGIAGGGMVLAGNARRRRETRAAERAARQGAAQAEAAITGGNPEEELRSLAADLDSPAFRPRKPRPVRQRDGIAERDQNTPGSNLQRTRVQ